MRVLLDNDGYVKYFIWEDNGGMMTEEDIVIDAPENVEDVQFCEEYFKYHIVDGKLVKDDNREMVVVESDPTTDERIKYLESNSATKDDVQAVWDAMAAAYNEGVQNA